MPTRTRRPRLTKAEREHEQRVQRHLALVATHRATEPFAAFLWPEEARRAHSVIAEDRMGERPQPWRFEERCRELERRIPWEDMG